MGLYIKTVSILEFTEVKIQKIILILLQRHVIMVVPLSADDEDIFDHELMAASLQRGHTGPPKVKLLRSTSIASWLPPPTDENVKCKKFKLITTAFFNSCL